MAKTINQHYPNCFSHSDRDRCHTHNAPSRFQVPNRETKDKLGRASRAHLEMKKSLIHTTCLTPFALLISFCHIISFLFLVIPIPIHKHFRPDINQTHRESKACPFSLYLSTTILGCLFKLIFMFCYFRCIFLLFV